jgi:signal transduction histidine kinase/ActR/RegA family two-component response regulator
MHALLHNSKPDGTPYPRGECPIYAAFQDGVVHRVDGEVFWRKDGSSFPVECVSTPIREGRELTGAVVTFKDVTERKQAEEARTGLEKQLRQSQKMEAVGRLTGGIAHDFNNLLTIIKGRIEFLLQGSGPEGPLRRHSEIIRKAADRAAALTQQLLAFSRKQVLQPKVLDPNAVVTGLVPLLQRLVREDIELVTVLGAGLGRVKADPGQLEQVIVNLVANARDAMPKGGQITIETANVEADDAVGPRDPAGRPRRSVMLVVRDTGVGMRSEIQADIFEPFFTTKEVGKGTGLGLATVYGIVTQHEGVIRVESAPGRGATFRIYLPRIEAAIDTVEPIEPPAVRSIRRGGSETVLLVEDEEEVRALAAEVLQGQGYTLLEAAHPHEALRLAERWTARIHLLLTDVVMPRMSGRQLADRLAGVRPAMKILYMSGYTDDIIARDGLLDPGTPLLAKPFTPDVLAEKVRAVLDAPRESEGPTPVAARSPREG